MNYNEYAPLAMRTAKVMDTKGMLAHGIMGLTTEVLELHIELVSNNHRAEERMKGISEECGDIAWFAVYTLSAIGRHNQIEEQMTDILSKFTSVFTYPSEFTQLAVFVENAATSVKAHLFYGKSFDEFYVVSNLLLALYSVRELANDALPLYGMGGSLARNIDKLQKRYPDKYSDQAAVTRADKAADDGVHALSESDAEITHNKALEEKQPEIVKQITPVERKNLDEVKEVLAGKDAELSTLHNNSDREQHDGYVKLVNEYEGKLTVQKLRIESMESDITNLAARHIVMQDAYNGAREELVVWKKRAEEAEASLRDKLSEIMQLREKVQSLLGMGTAQASN